MLDLKVQNVRQDSYELQTLDINLEPTQSQDEREYIFEANHPQGIVVEEIKLPMQKQASEIADIPFSEMVNESTTNNVSENPKTENMTDHSRKTSVQGIVRRISQIDQQESPLSDDRDKSPDYGPSKEDYKAWHKVIWEM